VDPRLRGRILDVLMAHRNRLVPKSLEVYGDMLVRLALIGDLDNVPLMEKVISGLHGNRIDNSAAAYRLYCRLHRLPEPIFQYNRDRRRQLPRLPSERVLQASLAIPRSPTWRTYWRLIYETGARPSEPFDLRVADVDLEAEKVRLGTLKYGGDVAQRELPISPLLTAMIRELTHRKNPEDYVFTMRSDPTRPLWYKRAEKVMEQVRRQLKAAGYDVNGLRLHIYRHAFGTRLYTATQNLPLVQRSLGHRDLKSTMIYVHIQPGTPRLYDVKVYPVGAVEEISAVIAEGWEKALQTADRVWFKRPRWVP